MADARDKAETGHSHQSMRLPVLSKLRMIVPLCLLCQNAAIRKLLSLCGSFVDINDEAPGSRGDLSGQIQR